MNERVKEIIISKGLHKYVTGECQRRMEMLADAIVLECIKVCEERASSAPMGSNEQCEAEDCAESIRKHFVFNN